MKVTSEMVEAACEASYPGEWKDSPGIMWHRQERERMHRALTAALAASPELTRLREAVAVVTVDGSDAMREVDAAARAVST